MEQNTFQRLNIYLKGGQTVSIDFKAEQASKLNAQIESFIKALGDAAQKDKNFLFQGARVVLVRLSDVSGLDDSQGKTPSAARGSISTSDEPIQNP